MLVILFFRIIHVWKRQEKAPYSLKIRCFGRFVTFPAACKISLRRRPLYPTELRVHTKRNYMLQHGMLSIRINCNSGCFGFAESMVRSGQKGQEVHDENRERSDSCGPGRPGNRTRGKGGCVDQMVPVALMLIGMPVSGSIGHAIGIGLISYTIMKVFGGKAKEVSVLTYIISALFLVKFFLAV